MDFEYAIKMDVRNNPIVREIDESRQRELWRWVAIGVCLVVVVLFSLWQRFTVMRVGTGWTASENVITISLGARSCGIAGRIAASRSW